MKMRLDAVVIILSVLFIYGLGMVNRDMIDLGPYAQLVLIVIYFSLFSWYDQFKREHLERNYILISSLLSIYLGAGIGYLFSQRWNGTVLGGGTALLVSLAVMALFRKPFYAWMDQYIGKTGEDQP